MQCSGTNHLEKTLILNLPKKSPVRIKGNLLGWKHDDVWSPSGFANEDNTAIELDKRAHHSTIYNSLIIVIYRNPIAWTRSIHATPHHAPKLHGISFSEFIRSPFETFFTPPGKDAPQSEEDRKLVLRSDRFWERYPDILTMRKTKIDIFESFKFRLPNVCYVNLETFNANPKSVLDVISSHYDIQFKKNFVPNRKDKHGNKEYAPKQYAKVSKEDLAHLMRRTHFSSEKMAGYQLKTTYRPLQIGQIFHMPSDLNSIFSHRMEVRAYSHERGDKLVTVLPSPSY